MQRWKGVVILTVAGLLISSSGCATARKKRTLQMDELRAQINSLEDELAKRDEELNRLERQLEQERVKRTSAERKPTVDKTAKQTQAEKEYIKKVQRALRNAGFDAGSVDGKLGKRTKAAIIEFQTANDLKPDGKVGPKTWQKLSPYLSGEVK